jgi:hypothetical protein
LEKQSNEASLQIKELVAADQKVKRQAIVYIKQRRVAHILFSCQRFMSAINGRLDSIQSDLEHVLPAVTQPGEFFSRKAITTNLMSYT